MPTQIVRYSPGFPQEIIACDGRCDKAWGINSRPSLDLSEDPDDTAYLADWELGLAPADPGTYEGGDKKPSNTPLPEEARHLMNKWCARECERCGWHPIYAGEALVLNTFNTRQYSIPTSATRVRRLWEAVVWVMVKIRIRPLRSE